MIAQNISEIKQRIARAAPANGCGVLLIAAAKTVSAERVREAVRAGVDAVGENRVQELAEKDAEGAYESVPLHFIGHLQKNKVSKIVGRVDLIHSIDSLALAEVVSSKAKSLGIRQAILLQVNIAREATKGGFLPEELSDALDAISLLRGCDVQGLMCIPPEGDTHSFGAMRRIFESERKRIPMEHLSMGMSGDYEEAVRAGSNMVRVGSALFGPRM
jgi:hypothetical protein